MTTAKSLLAALAPALLFAQAAVAAPVKPQAPEMAKKNVVALVVPFETGEGVPEWMGFAMAELITDLFAQANQGSWVAEKQLDSVLRRKDLQLYDAADPEVALPVARVLGASDVIVGSVTLEGGKTTINATRLGVTSQKASRKSTFEGTDLSAAAVKLARDLLDASPKEGPMTSNAAALQEAALCWLDLIRTPLQPHVGTVPPLDHAESTEAHCKAAVASDPNLGYAKAGVAILQALAGQAAAAQQAAAAAGKGRFCAEAYIAQSFAARRAGDPKAAQKALEAGIAARPGFLLAIGYSAEDRMDAEDYKAAVGAWDRYLKRAPRHPFALGQKAHALARLGKEREALALTREALEVDPGDPELLIELASRQIDFKQDKEAEETLRQAMEARPPRPLAWLRMGFLYLRQNRPQEAREVLTEAVTYAYREDESRTRGLAFADLAVVAGMQDRYKEAVEYLGAARAEGSPKKLPCDAAELRQFKGRPEFEAACAGNPK